MDDFFNAVKRHAGQLDQANGQPRIAIVTSVDTQTANVRVLIQPEGVLSGWLPIVSPWVGNGWGLVCPPVPGDQVLIICQEGNAEQGIVIGRMWSSTVSAPPTPAGELWLVHKSGSFLQLCNDGSIKSSAVSWQHSGDLYVAGDVFDQHGSLAALRGHYNEHVHPPQTVTPLPID